MDYDTGDLVVCINEEAGVDVIIYPKEGHVYRVRAMLACAPACSIIRILVEEVHNPQRQTCCTECGMGRVSEYPFHSGRFKKVDEGVREEMLNLGELTELEKV